MSTLIQGSLSTPEAAALAALDAAGVASALATLTTNIATARTACASTCPQASDFRDVLRRYLKANGFDPQTF